MLLQNQKLIPSTPASELCRQATDLGLDLGFDFDFDFVFVFDFVLDLGCLADLAANPAATAFSTFSTSTR